MVQKSLVAVADVLGFRRRVDDHGWPWVEDTYKRFFGVVSEVAELPAFGHPSPFNWASFSDTLLIWTEPIQSQEEERVCNHFYAYISGLVAFSITFELPLRIGIAAGETRIDREAGRFLGQPIIDAYEMESAQEWCGAAVHPSCAGLFDTEDDSVPVKAGSTLRPIGTIRWPWFVDQAYPAGSTASRNMAGHLESRMQRELIDANALPGATLEDHKRRRSAVAKWQATLRYYEWVRGDTSPPPLLA